MTYIVVNSYKRKSVESESIYLGLKSIYYDFRLGPLGKPKLKTRYILFKTKYILPLPNDPNGAHTLTYSPNVRAFSPSVPQPPNLAFLAL